MNKDISYEIEKIIEDMEFIVTLNQTISNLKYLMFLSINTNYEIEISKAFKIIENIKFQEQTIQKEKILSLMIGD